MHRAIALRIRLRPGNISDFGLTHAACNHGLPDIRHGAIPAAAVGHHVNDSAAKTGR